MPFAIVIPRLGWSMEQGTFVGWLKNDGDFVRAGEALFQLEGEKSLQDVEAVDEGILHIPSNAPTPGSVVDVGSIIGYLASEGESLTDSEQLSVSQSSADEVRVATPEGDERVSVSSSSEFDVRVAVHEAPVASPRARRLANELGIDWKIIAGTGANGRIREKDIRETAEKSRRTPPSPIPMKRITASPRRRLIAERLSTSYRQVVPVTLTTRADVSSLLKHRESLKKAGHTQSVPSYQDMIIKLVSAILPDHLLLASQWDGDAILAPGDDRINIGFAVDTAEGLVVPVIHDVGAMSLQQIASRSTQLVDQARNGRLTSTEIDGGAFTITNLGAFGIDAFTPIINYPQTAILGLGAVRRELVAGDGFQIVAQHQMTLSLTFDHRLIDGAPAARFLRDLTNAIASPPENLLA